MRLISTLLAAAAAFATTPLVAQAPGEESAVPDRSCDRTCLLEALGMYMDALKARNPAALPLADRAVFTENNVVLPVGQGLWGTVTDVDEVGLEVADPETGNAAWFGSVRENGEPAIYAVRLHLSDGRIDEIESVVHRKTGLPAPFGDVTKMVHDPAFYEVLPPKQRRPRERLIAIADSYFDTTELNDGQVFAPFDEDCGRLENGISTTSSGGGGGGANAAAIAQGCEEQFELGIYRINKRIRERLYPLVDVERGIVVASGFFDHANEFDRYLLTDGREMKTALKWPNSITLLEAFRIRDAKIHRIEAVFTYVPYFMHNPFAGPAAEAPSHPPAPEECGDACLASLAGQVMDGYVAKDWASLPWAERVAYAENSVGMQVGEGIWGTVTAIDPQPLVIADGATGNAVWIGRIEEHGQPAWAAITVEGAGEQIGGVDAVIRRKEYGAPWAEPERTPAFTALPAARRTPRNAMLAAVERFYEKLNRQDGAAPAGLASQCEWAVNGQVRSDCAAPFTGRMLQPLGRVRDREVLAVDETRGLVAVSAFEDFPAVGELADGADYPRSLQTVAIFRFDGGQLQEISSFTSELPYGMKPRR